MKDPRLRQHKLGFQTLVNRPSADELSDYYTRTYFQKESGNYRREYSLLELDVIGMRIAQRAARISALRGQDIPGAMLDVGCGEGFVISYFHKLGWEVAGIDFSLVGLMQINPHCESFVEQGDVFRLLDSKIENGEKYDLVWLGNVLEHVLDPVALLLLLRRLLTADGLLVVTVPNDGNYFHETLYANGDIPSRFWITIPDHISYFTAASLRQTAEGTGWECLGLQGDFPIDLFLAHSGSNYVVDRSKGRAAHEARLRLEYLIGLAGVEAANRFYESLAGVGLGRNITAFLRPS